VLSYDEREVALHKIFVAAEDAEQAEELNSGLTQMGFNCFVASNTVDVINQIMEQAFDLVLVDVSSSPSSAQSVSIWEQLREIERRLPVVALIPVTMLSSIESSINDFVIKPWNLSELAVRIRRILKQTGDTDSRELIRCGDLSIDLARCEVSINGRLLVLTFKEYELLKFLANNRGRVFTRENLLNEVWGYDYYGGDRTVDVHIRRLRSKIEDATHTFIETIRSIGYKFNEDT